MTKWKRREVLANPGMEQVIRAQSLTHPGCEQRGAAGSLVWRVQRDTLVHTEAKAELCALVLFHLGPFSSGSVFNSTLRPHPSQMQLGLKGGKEKGMAGGALREVAAYARNRAGQECWWHRAILPPAQHGDSAGHAGERRVTRGPHSPLSS